MRNNCLLFDLNLYDYEIIRRAAADYSRLMQVSIQRSGDFAQCEISKCIYDTDLTVNEFANYVLGLTIQKGAADVLD